MGNDSFTFKVNDGITDSNVGTITLTLTNERPAWYAMTEGDKGYENLATGQMAFTAGDVIGQLHATDWDGDPIVYNWDEPTGYLSLEQNTGIIRVVVPDALELALQSGDMVIPVHATDGFSDPIDSTFTVGLKVFSWQSYIYVVRRNGQWYTPNTSGELIAILRQIEQEGDKLQELQIKGHGATDPGIAWIEVGTDRALWSAANQNGLHTILLGTEEITATMQAICYGGTVISLNGCNTRGVAIETETALHEQRTKVFGSTWYAIGIPGSPWAIGFYE